MVEGRSVELCKRRGLKLNADKTNLMVLPWKEELECEIRVDGARLEQVSELKYFGYGLDK